MPGGGGGSVDYLFIHILMHSLVLTDLLLHGDEALVEGEVQAGVQRGHDLHHHLQPQLHGGDQHLELLGLHQHSTGR